jgi:hypothetical protein
MKIRRKALIWKVAPATVSVVAPGVANVTSASAVEGGSIVHTVTLTGAPTAILSLAFSLLGVTATGGGTDFTSALTSAAFNNGVTLSGGQLFVPIGVTSFTVTVPTFDDIIAEGSETYTISVGGISATGTILDNDVAPPPPSGGGGTGGSTTADAPMAAGTGSFVASGWIPQAGSEGVVIFCSDVETAADVDPSFYTSWYVIPGLLTPSRNITGVRNGPVYTRTAAYIGSVIYELSQEKRYNP